MEVAKLKLDWRPLTWQYKLYHKQHTR